MTDVVAVPLHEQVRTLLLHEIEVGEFAEITRLPTEPELCERFGVSRITVRRAVADLEAAGVVRRQQGRGTFITREVKAIGSLSLEGFSDMVVSEGVKSRRIIKSEVVPADAKDEHRLQVEAGSPVFHLVRVLSLNGAPVIYDNSRYPLSRYPGLDELIDESTSTYQVLKERYGVVFAEMRREVSVGFASARLAELMERPEHDAMFLIRKTAIGEKGEIIHTTNGRTVSSRMTLNVIARADT